MAIPALTLPMRLTLLESIARPAISKPGPLSGTIPAESLCVRRWGPGPMGTTCRNCVYAMGIQFGSEPLWFCKAMRDYAVACGEPLSDQIRPEWRACSHIVQRTTAA